jgi:4-amino-4-deoxy-L-arabinose transferase-like glycosyltransferase
LFLALTAYAIFLARNSTNVAGGSDSSGYLNSARLLASGQLQSELRVPAEFGRQSRTDLIFFTPFGFYPFLENNLAPPTYPVGLPLLFAAASKVVGWHYATFFVEIGGALAAILLCYLIARELGVSPGLALAGATAFGACPIVIFISIQPLSDTLAATWTLGSVFAALRARRHLGWAIVCGVVFSMAVLVRSTNAVMLPALVIFLGLDWRRLALLIAGGIPGALWFGYYNHTLFGGVLTTGYGNIYEDFSRVYVPGALVDFAKWLAQLLPGVLLLLPLAAPSAPKFRNRFLVALLAWFTAGISFFACVAFSHEAWWSLRYLLPTIPALILGGLLGVEALALRFPEPRRAAFLNTAAVLLTLWAVAGSFFWVKKYGVLFIPHQEQAYADSTRAARETFPKGSLVVSGTTCGALYAYTDFAILRADIINAPRFAEYAALAHAAGRPICALLFEDEEKSFRQNCPGDWQRVGTVRNLGLWRLTPPPLASSTPPAPAK